MFEGNKIIKLEGELSHLNSDTDGTDAGQWVSTLTAIYKSSGKFVKKKIHAQGLSWIFAHFNLQKPLSHSSN